MIFLLYVFCCNIMHSTIEGAENKVTLTKEDEDDVGDIGVSVPSGDDCPKITSFYTLFAKAYCISDKIRKGAQDV